MPIIHEDARNERINNLGTLNGLKLVLVSVAPGQSAKATLEVQFHNQNGVAAILSDITSNSVPAKSIFPIRGGRRLPAGPAVGEVHVTRVDAGSTSDSLLLTVKPVGDYSTYTLEAIHDKIDPFMGSIPFKFRPGCFTNNCAPEWEPAPPPAHDPVIDYLAKDYDSFRHTLITAMMQRVPGWQATSEADLDQVLIDLFSAVGDELSDYQDRVMNEAYFALCRKRVSLARHARLMDYHIHQGNQASTWLAFKIAPSGSFIPEAFTAWTSEPRKTSDAIVFATHQKAPAHHLLNRMRLYTWSGAAPALAAGDTQADLQLDTPGKSAAEEVRDLIHDGKLAQLLIQEWKNPRTGLPAGRNPAKRQLVRLLEGKAGATALQDPLTNTWVVRVIWRKEDALKFAFCFTSFCPTPLGDVDDISLFHGNLALAYQGDPVTVLFREPGTPLLNQEFHYERPIGEEAERRGVICRLPARWSPLAYLPSQPGFVDGEAPPSSTLFVEVLPPIGSSGEPWREQISLVHSDDSHDDGKDFVVETDELRLSVIRFGNGVNGRRLPDGARVRCTFQFGAGLNGNIGSDQLRFFDTSGSDITECWNPFDVINGRDPEPVETILRAAPEAYRARQLRAVTLADYVKRAESLPDVSRAVASYAWTGSWRTVRVAIDPIGGTELEDVVRRRIERHLDAVRLIGEDLEIRPPLFVPLAIEIALCINPEFWREDVRFVLEQEFSEHYTPNGRPGFFHPDRWTFGQPLHASEIAGRIHEVAGVEHLISISFKRWNDPVPATSQLVEVRFNEILRVRNDPDAMEDGHIRFELKGGRQ